MDKYHSEEEQNNNLEPTSKEDTFGFIKKSISHKHSKISSVKHYSMTPFKEWELNKWINIRGLKLFVLNC